MSAFPASWTGAEATALRRALKCTRRQFSRQAGVCTGTVDAWTAKPATVPRPEAQARLSRLLAGLAPEHLAGLPPETRARLEQLAPGSGPAAGGESDSEERWAVARREPVPRLGVNARAAAKEQFAAARASLGLTIDEFGAWITARTGLHVGDGVAGRWEGDGCPPPGEALLAAQEHLAGTGVPSSRVVGLSVHPRYRPRYRALAAGCLAAARHALDLDDKEFYAWLTRENGRPPAASPGMLRLRLSGDRLVPGDALITCQAYLAARREARKPGQETAALIGAGRV